MNHFTNIIVDKRSRSVVVLIITIVVILGINALLPVIEGDTHYTEDPITVTYKEYLEMNAENPNYSLTWNSEQKILLYKADFIKHNPDIPFEDIYTITPPDEFQVEVNTKFFFQYVFWYITTLVHIVSAILLFYAVFNFFLTKNKLKNPKYIDLVNQMDTLSNESLDPVTFEPWMVNPFNQERKIKQHKANIKYNLKKLDNKTNYKIRLLAKKDPEDPACQKYVLKKQELNSYLEDDYIMENVILSNVKGFLYIHPSFVTSGVNAISKTTDSFSLINTDRQRLGKDSVKKILTSVCLTVMFAILLTITIFNSLDKPWYMFIFDLLATIAPLVMQIPMALDYSETFMDEHLIPNLISRRTIALLYLASMKEVKHEDIADNRPVDPGSSGNRVYEQGDSKTI